MNGTPEQISLLDAFNYLRDGARLALSRECRAYIVIPIVINLVLMGSVGYLLFSCISDWMFALVELWPDFLVFLAYVFSVIFAVLIVFVSCYLFSTVATIIASPFYGLLADRAEMLLNHTQSEDQGVIGILRDVPRILRRELRKQLFFLPLAGLCLLVTLVPVINFMSPVLWFCLTSWMGCLQYCDYAYDNHKISFDLMKRDLKSHYLPTLAFGAVIALALSIPVLNLLVPPAAVCAGTRYYLEMRRRVSAYRG